MSRFMKFLSRVIFFTPPKKCPGCKIDNPVYKLAETDYQGVKGKKLYKCSVCDYPISD